MDGNEIRKMLGDRRTVVTIEPEDGGYRWHARGFAGGNAAGQLSATRAAAASDLAEAAGRKPTEAPAALRWAVAMLDMAEMVEEVAWDDAGRFVLGEVSRYEEAVHGPDPTYGRYPGLRMLRDAAAALAGSADRRRAALGREIAAAVGRRVPLGGPLFPSEPEGAFIAAMVSAARAVGRTYPAMVSVDPGASILTKGQYADLLLALAWLLQKEAAASG